MLQRVGIVGFFGILVPGSYLALSVGLALLAFSCESPAAFRDDLKVLLEAGTAVVTSAFLLVAYLLGMVLRLIGPNRIDSLSAFWFRRILLKPVNRPNLWMFDRFPYRRGMATSLNKSGMGKVVSFMRDLNSRFGRRNNTTFFNYCKLIIDANNPEVGRHIQNAEATVRFLAGSVLALGISFGVWAIVAVRLSDDFGLVPLLVGALNLFLALLILHRFRFQRRREVYMVWCAMYLLSSGGLPAKAGGEGPLLVEKIRVS